MFIGTNCFISLSRAIDYYQLYQPGTKRKETAEWVDSKLKDGKIRIGKPKLKEGETLFLNADEGRYFIQTPEPNPNGLRHGHFIQTKG